MIYVDTSVVLAQLLAEDRQPSESLWESSLVSSRLLEYETWNRLNSRGLSDSHGPLLQSLLERLGFLELRRTVLQRALESFPRPVRTLDALHLASVLFLVEQGHSISVATYDERMRDAGQALGLETFAP